MLFKIILTPQADADFRALADNPAKRKQFKAARKALGLLETNPRHPGLNTHKYQTKTGPQGEDVFEAYAENKTPGAYRIFWHYGPGQQVITIIAITPHP